MARRRISRQAATGKPATQTAQTASCHQGVSIHTGTMRAAGPETGWISPSLKAA